MEEIIEMLIKALYKLLNSEAKRWRIQNEYKQMLQKIGNAVEGYGDISDVTHRVLNDSDELQ